MRAMVKGSVLVLVGGVALRGAVADWTRTLSVPGDFATIQDAVADAGAFTTIEVGAGVYGPVTIGGSNSWQITIHGSPDAVIDGGDLPAVTILDAEDVVVDGFTVLSETDAVSVVRGSDVTIRNVTVQSAGGDGIRADTVTRVTITGNRVESAAETGINAVATTGEVFGTLIVTGNTVVSAGGDGIFVHDIGDGANSVVSGNVVEHAGERGIRSECGLTLTMEENVVTDTGAAALSIDSVSGQCTVSQNQVADAGGAGIEIVGAQQVVVAGNDLDGSAGDGVSVVGPDVQVLDNVIVDAGDAGVRITEADANYLTPAGAYPGETVASNRIVQPGGSGIVLAGVAPMQVVGNSIEAPVVHGIALDGARRVLVSMNDVTGAGSCGFRLEGRSKRNVLTDNTASQCKWGLWDDVARGRNRVNHSNRLGRRHAPR